MSEKNHKKDMRKNNFIKKCKKSNEIFILKPFEVEKSNFLTKNFISLFAIHKLCYYFKPFSVLFDGIYLMKNSSCKYRDDLILTERIFIILSSKIH